MIVHAMLQVEFYEYLRHMQVPTTAIAIEIRTASATGSSTTTLVWIMALTTTMKENVIHTVSHEVMQQEVDRTTCSNIRLCFFAHSRSTTAWNLRSFAYPDLLNLCSERSVDQEALSLLVIGG